MSKTTHSTKCPMNHNEYADIAVLVKVIVFVRCSPDKFTEELLAILSLIDHQCYGCNSLYNPITDVIHDIT